jgi:hypothetical protein
VSELSSGWKYGDALLERFGASPLVGDPQQWLAEWLPKLRRTIPHAGNHKYYGSASRSDTVIFRARCSVNSHSVWPTIA